FPAQETGEQYLIQSVRQWSGRGEGVNRIASQSDGDRHAFATFVITLAVARTYLVHLPMHCGCLFIVNLHPINADVTRPAFRISRMYIWKSDETPAVFWPAFEDREIEQ